MPRPHRCVDCGTVTDNTFNLCTPCNIARGKAECEAQGKPWPITDPVLLDRLDRLSRPPLRKADGSSEVRTA